MDARELKKELCSLSKESEYECRVRAHTVQVRLMLLLLLLVLLVLLLLLLLLLLAAPVAALVAALAAAGRAAVAGTDWSVSRTRCRARAPLLRAR